MDTNELLRGLNKIVGDACIRFDVISADKVKYIVNIPSPKIYISNLQPSSQKGNHWVTIYSPSVNEYEVFDSYGKSVASFGKYFNEIVKKDPIENCMTFQSLSSDVCSKYCLFYAHYRLNMCSYAQIINNFGCSKLQNDRTVAVFYDNYIACHPRCSNNHNNNNCRINQSCCSRKLNMYNKKFI